MSIFSALLGGKEDRAPTPAPAPPPPADDSAARAERDRAAEEERLRRVSSGRASVNPTGGLGVTQAPNLAAKSLLGS